MQTIILEEMRRTSSKALNKAVTITKEKGRKVMQSMDSLLKAAFEEMVVQDYENRSKKLPRHWFSIKFRWKMSRLLHHTEEKAAEHFNSIIDLYRPVRSKRKLLILLALLLILVGGTAACAQPVIFWLFQNYLEQHEDFVETQRRRDDTKMLKGTFEKYELAWMPEGYEMVAEEFQERFGEYQVVYENPLGYAMVFRQTELDKGNLGNITSIREGFEEVKINELQGYYIEDSNTYSLILSDEKYLFELSGSLSKEELLKAAESLEVEK